MVIKMDGAISQNLYTVASSELWGKLKSKT
jgi:hypothetical protein